ncbi:MAG TPA: hypothetical protein VGB14_13385 [Acidimicrobiales bacterium]
MELMARRIRSGEFDRFLRRSDQRPERDGYPVGGDSVPVSGGGVADPTFAAVVANEESRDQRDFVDARVSTAARCLDEAVGSIQSTLRAMDEVTGSAPKGRESSAGICANPACQEATHRPRAGRCPPCYIYRRRHGGQDAPAEVIAARRAGRPLPRDDWRDQLHDGADAVERLNPGHGSHEAYGDLHEDAPERDDCSGEAA